MADYLNKLRDRLDHGEAVSGPAALRMLQAARAAGTRFEGMFLTPRQARALLTDPALQVHDNPRAFPACNYDPVKALCHPGRAAGPAAGHPSLGRRNRRAPTSLVPTPTSPLSMPKPSGCAPTPPARCPPGPLRDRLTQRATALQQIADRHARTRITSKAADDQS